MNTISTVSDQTMKKLTIPLWTRHGEMWAKALQGDLRLFQTWALDRLTIYRTSGVDPEQSWGQALRSAPTLDAEWAFRHGSLLDEALRDRMVNAYDRIRRHRIHPEFVNTPGIEGILQNMLVTTVLERDYSAEMLTNLSSLESVLLPEQTAHRASESTTRGSSSRRKSTGESMAERTARDTDTISQAFEPSRAASYAAISYC